ncbi:Hypothetical predicted protein [Cloeon dipterum]|uniref:Uncharacterized protein n=1 Tax=Cloeon dipterum TaxID=197152 RepID=A0A8S1DX06_9INSE|nr:Hypothetical predicted protein [Cloeon dipterum]
MRVRITHDEQLGQIAEISVFAVHVDREKLQTWFLNVCGHEFAEEIEDHDLICYFCAWHAEFQWKIDKMEDDDLVWRNLDLDLDDAAKELSTLVYIFP